MIGKILCICIKKIEKTYMNKIDAIELLNCIFSVNVVEYDYERKIQEWRLVYMPEIDSIKAIIQPLAVEYGLKRIYLFGSFAKGTANEDSDIDLLIEKGKPMSLLKLSGFRQDVEEKMKRSVDVVTTAGIEAEFADAISGTEILLYEE